MTGRKITGREEGEDRENKRNSTEGEREGGGECDREKAIREGKGRAK